MHLTNHKEGLGAAQQSRLHAARVEDLSLAPRIHSCTSYILLPSPETSLFSPWAFIPTAILSSPYCEYLHIVRACPQLYQPYLITVKPFRPALWFYCLKPTDPGFVCISKDTSLYAVPSTVIHYQPLSPMSQNNIPPRQFSSVTRGLLRLYPGLVPPLSRQVLNQAHYPAKLTHTHSPSLLWHTSHIAISVLYFPAFPNIQASLRERLNQVYALPYHQYLTPYLAHSR